MGSTFVTLGRDAQGNRTTDIERQVGFWMRDESLMLWLRLMALHIDFDGPTSTDNPACAIRHQFLFASQVHFNGCVPHKLEKATENAEGFAIVSHAAHSLSAALMQCSTELCGATVNLLNSPAWWLGNIQTDYIKEIVDAFLRLLNSEVTSTVSTPNAMVPKPCSA